MDLSFEIEKKNKFKRDVEHYTELIKELKLERESLLEKHCKAVFNKDEINAKRYLLRLSANSLLMDAYRICLDLIELDMKGV